MAAKEPAKKSKRPSAIKRDMQNEERRLRNKAFKSHVRTKTRAFEEALAGKDQTLIQSSLNEVFSVVDKGVKRGLYKANKASRTKSRAAAKVTAKA